MKAILVFAYLCYLTACLPLPTPSQLKYQRLERGAIIHFNMATSAGSQGCANGQVPDPKIFNPTLLNTDQWIRSMKDLGIKYAVLVAKHNCGFCTWPTAVNFPEFKFSYNYSVNASTYRGNVVKQFVDSCRKEGIDVGFYYSVVTNSYLNVENGKVQGGPLKPGQVAVTQEQYNQIVLAQLTELWTQNGELTEIWFDGGYQQDIKQPLIALLQKLQPNAVAFNGYGVSPNPVRWIGTESGHAPYPTWATGTSNGGDPNSPVWAPAECDFTLQSGDNWFYGKNFGLLSVAELVSVYHDSVGRGCNMLIDFAPTPEGILPDNAVNRYKEFGAYLENCYGNPVGSTSGEGNSLILTIKNTTIDRVVIQEDIDQGQRVRSYSVQGFFNNSWTTLSVGTSIGNKRIVLFSKPVMTTKLQVVATSAVEAPVWYNFAAFAPCPPP